MKVLELIDQVADDYLQLTAEQRLERSRDISYFLQSVTKIVTTQTKSRDPLSMEIRGLTDECYRSVEE
jgi:hypothetical protein